MRKVLWLAFVVIVAIVPGTGYTYPGSCAPATDLLSCLQCASQNYDSCYSTYGLSFKCKQDCSADLRADWADCHDNFEPLWV